MSTWALVDLDGSLFRSKKRARPPLGVAATVDRSGRPYSYASPAQQRLFELLGAADRIIPVTARPTASFRRVTLPFTDVAVCAMGGVLLTADGTPDPGWQRRMADALAAHQSTMRAIIHTLGSHPVRVRPVVEDDVLIYVNVRHFDLEATPLEALHTTLAEAVRAGWRQHAHRDQIAILPPPVSKGAAVDHLLAQGRPELVLGLGDTWADVDFLSRCDFALTPRTGQLLAALQAIPRGPALR